MSDLPTVNAAQLQTLVLSHGVRPILLTSEGKPRDVFGLTADETHPKYSIVPAWRTRTTTKLHIRPGTIITFVNAEAIDTTDFEKSKQTLVSLNIHPMGDINADRGFYDARPLTEYQKWFSNRHAVTSLNPQEPLVHLRQLRRNIMGEEKFQDLSHYLADHMLIFKNAYVPELFVIDSFEHRVSIVERLLAGIADSTRYTRFEKERCHKAFLFDKEVQFEGTSSSVVGGKSGLYVVLGPEGQLISLPPDRIFDSSDQTYVIASPPDITGKVAVETLLA